VSPADLAQRIAALDWSATSLQHQLAVTAAVATLNALEPHAPQVESNVVALPVRPRTRWTTLYHMDGRKWATSSHFGPEGAWNWVVETVAHEWGVTEDQVSSLEGSEDQYDNDDVVTIDGIPTYRLRHSYK
jgi:hypothetical protein